MHMDMAAAEVSLACWLMLGFSACFILLCKWNAIRYKRKGLPAGTMGWPVVGETIEFLKQGPNFMKSQSSRYGKLFKSHLLGSPTIVSLDPDLNKYILLSEAKGFVPGYPKSMTEIFGEYSISSAYAAHHKRLRGSMLSLIGPLAIKDKLMPQMNDLIRRHINGWDGKTIDIQEQSTKMAFFIAFHMMVKTESATFYEAFKLQFDKIVQGTLSLAINFPGTNYSRAFEASRKVKKFLQQLIDQRRASSACHDDMLGYMLRNDDFKHNFSNDTEMIDQIITILYSGYETVSKTTMMTVKYLHDNPRALQKIREENLAIREGRKAEDTVDWNDYKSMNFTRAVILETLRLATVVNGVMRKTSKQMELNGYVIPEGWKIYLYTREINYDPLIYPEPSTFNPWRWLEKSLDSHNHFLLFGAGPRLCPGKELGLSQITIFLHYFVTGYRWEEVAGGKLTKFPRVDAPNGLHMKVEKY